MFKIKHSKQKKHGSERKAVFQVKIFPATGVQCALRPGRSMFFLCRRQFADILFILTCKIGRAVIPAGLRTLGNGAVPGGKHGSCAAAALQIQVIDDRLAGRFPKGSAKVIFAESGCSADVVQCQRVSIVLGDITDRMLYHVDSARRVLRFTVVGSRRQKAAAKPEQQLQNLAFDRCAAERKPAVHFGVNEEKGVRQRFVAYNGHKVQPGNRKPEAVAEFTVDDQAVIPAAGRRRIDGVQMVGIDHSDLAGRDRNAQIVGKNRCTALQKAQKLQPFVPVERRAGRNAVNAILMKNDRKIRIGVNVIFIKCDFHNAQSFLPSQASEEVYGVFSFRDSFRQASSGPQIDQSKIVLFLSKILSFFASAVTI